MQGGEFWKQQGANYLVSALKCATLSYLVSVSLSLRSFVYSYTVDIHIDRAEDVLLHQKVLAMARDPENRPAFHIRLLEVSTYLFNILFLLTSPLLAH